MSERSELAAGVREALAALAAADPKRARFGAAAHGYQLGAPRNVAVELPEDMAEFVAAVGCGGAGPGYGWFDVEAAGMIEAPAGVAAYGRGIPVCHLGCGYAVVVALDGEARGQAWLDARAIGIVRPLAPTFTALYLAWIEALANNEWPVDVIPPAHCSLAAALSGYFGMVEGERGLPAGTLAGEELRAALAQLGPGAIQIAADAAALFDQDDTVDPCLTCARLLDALAADGLRRDVLVPGVPPRQQR